MEISIDKYEALVRDSELLETIMMTYDYNFRDITACKPILDAIIRRKEAENGGEQNA